MDYKINGKIISVKSNKFSGKLSIIEYERLIYSSFKKIGVTENHISINYENEAVVVIWDINGNNFSFTSKNQEDQRSNLGAVCMAIVDDVRQIQRGIKDIFMVMKQYSNEDLVKSKKKNLSHFDNYSSTSKIDFSFSKDNISIFSSNHARQIISDIKQKYPKFKDFKYLPEEEKRILRAAYYYLNLKVNF